MLACYLRVFYHLRPLTRECILHIHEMMGYLLEACANCYAAFKLLTGTLKMLEESDGTEPPREETDTSEDESDPEEDVLEASTNEICRSISSLFRFSVAIQNLSSRDRLERMEKD
jgi:hypothetical protein